MFSAICSIGYERSETLPKGDSLDLMTFIQTSPTLASPPSLHGNEGTQYICPLKQMYQVKVTMQATSLKRKNDLERTRKGKYT